VGRRWATPALSTGDPSGYPHGDAGGGIVLARYAPKRWSVFMHLTNGCFGIAMVHDVFKAPSLAKAIGMA